MKKNIFQEPMHEAMPARIATTVTKQPECLLEAMELISESANNTHLTDDFLGAASLPAFYPAAISTGIAAIHLSLRSQCQPS